MKTIFNKLKSRKFLAALAGFGAGLAMVFGLDETVINTVAGAVMAAGSVMTYIMAEGRVDAAAVVDAVAQTTDAAKLIGGDNDDCR